MYLHGQTSVLHSDQTSCWISLKFPDAQLGKVGGGFDYIRIEGLWPDAKPGQPALPGRTIFVAVPEGAQVTVEAEPGRYREVDGLRLAPVPTLGSRSEAGLSNLSLEIDAASYNQIGYSPFALAELVAVEPLRQLTAARIRVNPVQYDPVAGKVRIFSEMVIKARWNKPGRDIGVNTDAAFEPVYASLIQNYPIARNWVRSPARPVAKNGDPFDQSNWWYRISLLKEGIYFLDRKYLVRQGINPEIIDPRTIKILTGGSQPLPKDYTAPYSDSLKQVAVWVWGEADGRFDDGDAIVFYGRDLSGWGKNSALPTAQFHNPYCDTNVYWLTWGGQEGLRMPLKNGEPTGSPAFTPDRFTDTLHSEQDVFNPFNSGELWYWKQLQRSGAEETKRLSVGFDLPELLGAAGLATLSYRPSDGGRHRMRWGLNNQLDRDRTWTGDPTMGERRDTMTFSAMAPTGNSFDIELVKSGADSADGIYLDWFEVAYQRGYQAANRTIKFRADTSGYQRSRFHLTGLASDSTLVLDISDPDRPQRIRSSRIFEAYAEFEDGWQPGNRYFAAAPVAWIKPAAFAPYQPQRLRSNYLDARYLVIAADEVWVAASRLHRYHQGQARLQPVKIVKLSWIYNEFGFGLRDPSAIRNFLKHLFLGSNRTSPVWCLLFGNGNFDYRHRNQAQSNINLVPSHQEDGLGYVLLEYHFNALDDWFAYFDTGSYPQVALARLPATSASEAEAMVDKIIRYDTGVSFGPWRNRVLFMADDNKERAGDDPIGWGHLNDTEQLSTVYLPPSYDRIKVYGCEYPLSMQLTKPDARSDIIRHWSEGAGLVNFIGHGSYWTWGHEEYFKNVDVPYLTNGDRLPLVVTASCGISRFDNPTYRCINAALVTKADGGAIATFGDMREGGANANYTLNHNLYTAIFNDGLDLGLSTFTAKYRTQSINYNNRPYVLLGDPAVRLGSPRCSLQLTLSSDTLLGRGRYWARGHIMNSPSPYTGQALVRLFDVTTWVDSAGGQARYQKAGKAIFQGLAQVAGDSFQLSFNVPDQFYILPRPGSRLSAYAWGPTADAAGSTSDTVWLGGLDTTRANDHRGPAISLWAGGVPVLDGDFVPADARLAIRISDPLGVNIVPGVQEGEIRIWADREQHYDDMGQQFIYDTGSDSSGQAEYARSFSSDTTHQLVVRAYDCFSNLGTLTRSFRVGSSSAGLSLVYNYPNPMKTSTCFTFQLPLAEDVTIRIYTVAGRLIKTIEAPGLRPGYNQVNWDGRDQDGDQPANGVYLYQVAMNNGTTAGGQFSKLVIMR